MLSALKPSLCEVGRSGQQDWYLREGDPMGYRNMCAESVRLIWNVELEPLATTRVWCEGGVLGDRENGKT